MPESKTTLRWVPIDQAGPVATAAATLAGIGVDQDMALRLAPIAAGVDDIDRATPINPAWPGIGMVEDLDAERPHLPPAAFALELVGEEEDYGDPWAGCGPDPEQTSFTAPPKEPDPDDPMTEP